jgi:hypothetical protein
VWYVIALTLVIWGGLYTVSEIVDTRLAYKTEPAEVQKDLKKAVPPATQEDHEKFIRDIWKQPQKRDPFKQPKKRVIVEDEGPIILLVADRSKPKRYPPPQTLVPVQVPTRPKPPEEKYIQQLLNWRDPFNDLGRL